MDINAYNFWVYLRKHTSHCHEDSKIIPLHGNMLVLFIESISTPIKCTVPLGN
jgi:hypothetical protein